MSILQSNNCTMQHAQWNHTVWITCTIRVSLECKSTTDHLQLVVYGKANLAESALLKATSSPGIDCLH